MDPRWSSSHTTLCSFHWQRFGFPRLEVLFLWNGIFNHKCFFWHSSQFPISLPLQPHSPSLFASLPSSSLTPSLHPPPTFVLSHLSPGSDAANRCTESSSDVLASDAVVPLSLSLSPALSPEEFEHLWLRQQGLHAEQGNKMATYPSDSLMPRVSSSWDRNCPKRSKWVCCEHWILVPGQLLGYLSYHLIKAGKFFNI